MKESLEFGHVIGHKSAVLADAVAAQWRGLGLGVLGKKSKGLARGLGLVDRACLHTLDESGAPVMGLVPLVHRVEYRIALLYSEHRALGDEV